MADYTTLSNARLNQLITDYDASNPKRRPLMQEAFERARKSLWAKKE